MEVKKDVQIKGGTIDVRELLHKIGGEDAVLEFEVGRRIIPLLKDDCDDKSIKALDVAKFIVARVGECLDDVNWNKGQENPEVDQKIIACFREYLDNSGIETVGLENHVACVAV